MPALQRLRAASRFGLARMALGGLHAKPDPDALACLKRMDLAQPRRIADHVTALVLRGALAQTLHS
jgi:hypothetical protein